MTKKRGHYCSMCGRSRPNEAFSGRGHRDHICRECASVRRRAMKLRRVPAAPSEREEVLGVQGIESREEFRGRWRIAEMELWDAEYLDCVVHAFIEFETGQTGSFQFGTVSGGLDCRFGMRDGAPIVEFSWEGQSETDAACGRGWAVLLEGRLKGRIFLQGSDDSAFIASRPESEDPNQGRDRRSAKRSRPQRRAARVHEELRLRYIEALVNGRGTVDIGRIGPEPCGAAASEGGQVLALLVRGRGESLRDLLARLDAAIENAWEHQVYIDELNA